MSNPLSFLGSLLNPLSPAGAILSLTGLEGSSPAPANSSARRQAMAQYAADTGIFGRYGAEKKFFKVPDFSTETASPSSTLAASTAASERAYVEEKRRATQLTEQDQLAKKYKVADLTKAYNTAASPEEKEKIGLQIWATTNPGLAARLKPGQLGYTEAQTAARSQGPLGVINQAVGDMQYAEKIGLGIPSPTSGTAFALETPLTNVPVPPTSQAGITEAFTKVSPNVTAAFKGDVFKPDLSQTQLALLKQAFERGLK